MNLPLHASLSYALVAFTIEFDNAAELQIKHATTEHGGDPDGVWLASMAMYWNCMRYVDSSGMTLEELHRLAKTPTNLDGMRRWRYVKLEGTGKKTVLRATRRGLQAKEVWEATLPLIEERWASRFDVEPLRAALLELVGQFEYDLPDCMPILGYGFAIPPPPIQKRGDEPLNPLLVVLMAKLLTGFGLLYERQAKVSLAISANVLRLVGRDGIPLKEIPARAGMSKEAMAMATGFLSRHGFAVIEQEEARRPKILVLTAEGWEAQTQYPLLCRSLEARWAEKFGSACLERLRATLEPIVGDGTSSGSPLFQGLTPAPSNWRAKVPPPRCLPAFPLVLHRGGYPDGS